MLAMNDLWLVSSGSIILDRSDNNKNLSQIQQPLMQIWFNAALPRYCIRYTHTEALKLKKSEKYKSIFFIQVPPLFVVFDGGFCWNWRHQ
jgi:hypothetical protein